MTADPAADAGHSVKAGTNYVVLVQAKAGETGEMTIAVSRATWREVGEFTAASAEAAVRQYAEQAKTAEQATLVAVPVRNWSPLRVVPKQVTTIEVSAA
jgi:hypothetical protein